MLATGPPPKKQPESKVCLRPSAPFSISTSMSTSKQINARVLSQPLNRSLQKEVCARSEKNPAAQPQIQDERRMPRACSRVLAEEPRRRIRTLPRHTTPLTPSSTLPCCITNFAHPYTLFLITKLRTPPSPARARGSSGPPSPSSHRGRRPSTTRPPTKPSWSPRRRRSPSAWPRRS